MYYKLSSLQAVTIVLLFNLQLISTVHSQEKTDPVLQSRKAPPLHTVPSINRRVSILEGVSSGESFGFRFYSNTESFMMPIIHLMAWGEESALSEYLLPFLFGDQESPDDAPDNLIPNLAIPAPEPSQFDALSEELRILEQELTPYTLAAKPSIAENLSEYTLERLGVFPEAMQSASSKTASNSEENSSDDDSSTKESASKDDDPSQPNPPETNQPHLDSMIPLLQQTVDAILSGKLSLIDKERVFTLQKSLHEVVPARLSWALEAANISKETYIQRQRQSKQVKALLIPDPLVTKLEQDELSEYLLKLQERFQIEGIHGFTCPEEFTVILKNMITLLKTEQNKLAEDSYVREQLGLLEQEMIAAKSSVISLTYINLMTLVVRFIGMYNALGMYEFATEYSRFKNGEMTESDLNYLIGQYFAITTEKLLQKDFVLSSILADLLGSTEYTIFHLFEKCITDYLRSEPDYLVWPTVSDFSESFFPKAGRYAIFVAGIQTAPVSFHDNQLMSRASLFFHDFLHASYMRQRMTRHLKIEKGQIDRSFSVNAQKVLDTVNYALNCLTLDRHTHFAVWISIFDINHELGRPLQTLISEGAFIMYKLSIAFQSVIVEEGFTFLHLRAANKILLTLFPEKPPLN